MTRRILLPACALAVTALTVGAALPAQAAGATHYKNCTALHASHNGQFKGGVAKPGAKDKRASGHARYKPYVSNTWYQANKGLDRDKDGIACEQ